MDYKYYVSGEWPIVYNSDFITRWMATPKMKDVNDIEKYIINEGATIIFWKDKTKTISKRHEDDAFDKELGFLFAYFYKRWDDKNKSSRKRVLNSVKEEYIKTFLLEFFARDNEMSLEKAKNYLKNLKVSK